MQAPEPFEPYTQISQPHPADEYAHQQRVTTPSRRRWVKVLLWIGITLFALVAFLYTLPHILNLVTSDIPPIDDSDLMPAVRNIPQENNGWRFVEELNAEVERTGLGKEPLKELLANSDPAQVQALLEKNARALALYRQIAEAPDFQDPALANPDTYSYDQELQSLNGIRIVSRLMLLEARFSLNAGDATSTVSTVDELLSIIHHFLRPNTTIINVMVSSSMYRELLTEIQTWVSSQLLTMDVVASLYAMVSDNDLDSVDVGFRNALMVEYAVFKNSALSGFHEGIIETENVCFGMRDEQCQRVLAFGEGDTLYYRPNKTIAMYAGYIRANMHGLDKGCEASPMIEYESDRLPENMVLLYVTENAIGKLLISVLTQGDYARFMVNVCELHQAQATLLEDMQRR